MTSLFISYGRADRERAFQVASWLRGTGFSAVFLDADPDEGIVPGRRWERELYAALRRSDATIFLASDASAASRWCFAELTLTRSLGKPVVPARIGGNARLGLVADVQEVNLTGPAGFARLTAALRKAGVGPDDTFAWNPSRSPYPGLEAFGIEDAAVFFGRGAETDRLLELLQPTLARGAGRWVCIVGPSGSGKSSLLHAGLLPRLARLPERWLVVPPFIPGTQPTRRLAASLCSAFARHGRPLALDELEHELAAAGTAALRQRLEQLREAAGGVTSVLVVIDQFEEVATRTGKREQQSFLRLLDDTLTEESPLWIVASMRSEFLSTDPDRAGLSEVIDDPLVIGPLSRARLPDVIVRPAQRVGLDFEPGLVERIVEDTTGGDALPLLAYTLHELAARVEHADSTIITTADYEAVGGVVGALQIRANRLVDDLTRRHHGQQLIDRTLLRLATVDEDGLPVRRRLPQSALDPEERTIIDAFVDARLLVVGRTGDQDDPATGVATVEVAHEALLRQWHPLRQAIESAQDSLRMRAELGREAADWEAGGRDTSYLLHGGRLGAFDDWAVQHPGELETLERQFLEASRAASRQQLHAVRRTNRRLRLLSAGLAAVLLIALGTAGFAVQEQAEADSQASLALGRQLLAQASLLRSSQPDVSLLLDVEALRQSTDISAEQARYALVDGLNRAFHISTQLVGHVGKVNAIEFSPDGSTAATAGEDGKVRLWDVAGGELSGEQTTIAAGPLAFGPDGSILAVVSGPTVQLWDTATRRPRGGPLIGHRDLVHNAVFSPDGSILATASADHTVRLWDVATGSPHGQPLVGHDNGVFAVAISPDGRTVAAGGWGPTVHTWDVATGRPDRVLAGHTGAVAIVAFSADSMTLYSGSEDGTLRLWDLRSGSARQVLAEHSGAVTTMALSLDGSTLASGGEDATVRLWDAVTGEPRGEPLTGHTDVIVDLAFTPDGRTLVSGSNDGTLRLWDPRAGLPRGDPLTGHTSSIMDIAVSPDGRTVASAGADSTARLWQTSETRPLGQVVYDDAGRFNSVAIDRNKLLAAAGSDGRVRLWDLASGTPKAELTGHLERVDAVAISSSGILASGGDDRTVRLWDAATHRPIGEPLRTDDAVLDVAFSRDGVLVAAAGADGTVTLWNTVGGALRGEFMGHTGHVNAVAFGAGNTLASGGDDGTVRLWNTATDQPERELLTANDAVQDVSFSPDGSLIAAAGADAAIRFWDAATGTPHGNPVTGFTSWINDIAFSPDGRTIASAADEGLQLWDVETGWPRGARLQEATRSFGVAFDPDGFGVASASQDMTTVWNLHPDHLMSEACRIANRNLSPVEWDRFFTSTAPFSNTCPQP